MDNNNQTPEAPQPTEGYQATPAYQPPPAANTNPPPQQPNPYAAPPKPQPPQSGYSSQQNPYATPQSGYSSQQNPYATPQQQSGYSSQQGSYAAPQQPQNGYSSQQNPYATPQPNANKPQYTANPAADTSNDKLYGILAYIGPLFLVGMIAAPNSKFAKYHANQGLVLFLAEVIWGAISGTLSAIFTLMGLGLIGPLLGVVSIVFFVLMILGIVNASAMKEEPLPVIGGITILK